VTDDLRFDLDIQKKDLLDLSSADGVAMFFARLRYGTSARALHSAASLGITEAVGPNPAHRAHCPPGSPSGVLRRAE
jgi:hypothetical protein